MKYLNIIKKIELDKVRKKNKHRHKNKFTLQAFCIENWLLILALSLFAISIIILFLYEDSLWPFVFLISSYLIIYFVQILFIYKSIKKEIKWFRLPFNRAININIKSSYCSDKKYFKELLLLDVLQLKFGYLELNNEYEYFKKRIHLVIGSLDKLGILPGVIATIGVLPKTIEAFGTSWISIFSYAYMILMIISLYFYNIIVKYERILSLTKLAIESKENKTK